MLIELPPKLNINSQDFNENKYEYFKVLRESHPVYSGKASIMKAYFLSRYEDCVNLLKDPRFVRNRTTATGGKNRLPFPVPKSIQLLANSMINEDEPAHRRLRNLVHKAFTPGALRKLEERIESLTNELLDKAEPQETVDLMPAYCLPIPVTVIQEMVGVNEDDMPQFQMAMRTLQKGFSGFRMLKTMFWDMPKTAKFVRQLIAEKRTHPADDILTGLIHAEEDGETLSEDELVSMVFLLIFAGYETTVHLITNAVQVLLTHPDQLAKLRAEPELMESAVEEILRYRGPVQSSKPAYATEEITLHGITIPKGAMVFPMFGSANHDPAVFENPERFDISREPNRHLGFGYGIHFCLGAPLARLETQIALRNLLNRNPNLKLAVSPEELKLVNMPFWHKYAALPVTFG